MWDVPRYRIRAYVRAKKKNKQARNSAIRHEFHIRRAMAEIRATESVGTGVGATAATMVLNELTPKGVMLYSQSAFAVGQKINLTVSGPKLFFVRGRVLGCQSIQFDSKIIRTQPLGFRIMVVFEFQNFYEREQVRLHCSEIERGLYPLAIEAYAAAAA